MPGDDVGDQGPPFRPRIVAVDRRAVANVEGHQAEVVVRLLSGECRSAQGH